MRFVDIIRNQTNIGWSEEIWIWIDADFRYFKTKEFNLKSENAMVHFCSMLDSVQLPFSELAPYGQIIREQSGISPVGILVMMDMIKNEEEWRRIGLDPDLLPNASRNRVPNTTRTGRNIHKPLDYKKYYQAMKTIVMDYPEITTKPAECQLLELTVLFSQDKLPAKKDMLEFGKFADELKKRGLLKIVKDSHSNQLTLCFDDKNLTDEKGKLNKQGQCILLMYKIYKLKGEKTDLIKSYEGAAKMQAALHQTLSADARGILTNVIQAIIANLSLEQTEDSLKKLKPSIESYDSADLRLFKSAKLPKEKSDKLLDVVFKNVYFYDGEKKQI